ncbi:helix-turn-helix domain-containing protein [Streptomyces sp. SID3343]|uniref:MarR family winged helix-turn-helix transcriptional regulator n=1 Tax=Streptomyces sp. SID3343 TaxID=2690260 RepID=UPI001EFF807B|nr:helix-turn-helix domain-containing protein [Streptomyces sp. SID3343]
MRGAGRPPIRFTERIQPYGLKPEHVGLMAVLAAGTADSQQDIARTMGVAPSLVVTLADHLEELDAIRRERDPADRRRQILTLTLRATPCRRPAPKPPTTSTRP